MKAIITWCKNYMSLIAIVECVILWLLFCSFIWIFQSLDVVKAFAPLIVGLLGVLIAYGQFQLSKWQKEIAKMKFDQDILDKKYDVLKRWNAVYYDIVNIDVEITHSQLLMVKEKFSALSDELCFVFDQHKDITLHCNEIKQKLDEIVKGHNYYILNEHNSKVWYIKNQTKDSIVSNRKEMMEVRKILLEHVYKELGLIKSVS